jgi:hypothetical protein
VLPHPLVEVSLQVLDGAVELLAERDAVERVEQGLVEPLADAVGLRALSLGARVIAVLDGEGELIVAREKRRTPRNALAF